jgi:CUB domain
MIGRFCGTTVPDPVTTSSNFLWVKFFTDATTERTGFEATVVNVDPVCGSPIAINATYQPQVTFVGVLKPLNFNDYN